MIIIYILLALLLITALYLLAIMPSRSKIDFSNFNKHFYAHRGLHKEVHISPENSYAAFELAVKNNYGIELDVQLTKDNIPVVFHDYTLERLCGKQIHLIDLTLEELQQYTLYSSYERIPTLESILNLVDGKVPLIIEYKIKHTNNSVCKYSNDLLVHYKGSYCIESFNPFALYWYKKNRPDIIRGQLSSNFIKDKNKGNKLLHFIVQNLLINFITKPHFIAYNHKYANMLSFNLCRKLFSITTFAWTVQSQDEYETCNPYFDYIIFEQFHPKKIINKI